ncbi:MAG: hypothetical protein V4506_19240 [Bacteroidota bacterium]
MKKENVPKLAVIAVVVILVSIWIYRHFIEFNNSEVEKNLSDNASKYAPNDKQVYSILQDSVNHILNSRSLTNQVRSFASSTGLPKEKCLVDAAFNQAKSFGYIA